VNDLGVDPLVLEDLDEIVAELFCVHEWSGQTREWATDGEMPVYRASARALAGASRRPTSRRTRQVAGTPRSWPRTRPRRCSGRCDRRGLAHGRVRDPARLEVPPLADPRVSASLRPLHSNLPGCLLGEV
jgi:hypothetical protein